MVKETLFSLSGKNVLLTGATGYLGLQMADKILDAGATLVLPVRNKAGVEKMDFALSKKYAGRYLPLLFDLMQPDVATSIANAIAEKFECLHGIVNNAYAGKVGPIEDIERSDFLAAATYNISLPFELVMKTLALLEKGFKTEGKLSSVVNIASMYGTVSPDPEVYAYSGKNNPVHYGATKSGMIQMSRYLACHLGARGVRVNSVSPGPFPDIQQKSTIPGFYEELARRVPLKRVGNPNEIAGPVIFLLSDAASYVNGVNLPVDGGWTAW